MSVLLRYCLALCLAALVTLALLMAMSSLITSDGPVVANDRDVFALEFVELQRDESERDTRRRLNERPPEPAPPPVQPPQPSAISFETPEVRSLLPILDSAVDKPLVSIDLGKPKLGPLGVDPNDRDIVVVSRVLPLYPRAAARKGIEGWVKVAFSVNKAGIVEDVSVLESEPAQVFDGAAINAVRKWRFKPRIQDGNPVAARVSQVLEFNLDINN